MTFTQHACFVDSAHMWELLIFTTASMFLVLTTNHFSGWTRYSNRSEVSFWAITFERSDLWP